MQGSHPPILQLLPFHAIRPKVLHLLWVVFQASQADELQERLHASEDLPTSALESKAKKIALESDEESSVRRTILGSNTGEDKRNIHDTCNHCIALKLT